MHGHICISYAMLSKHIHTDLPMSVHMIGSSAHVNIISYMYIHVNNS